MPVGDLPDVMASTYFGIVRLSVPGCTFWLMKVSTLWNPLAVLAGAGRLRLPSMYHWKSKSAQ